MQKSNPQFDALVVGAGFAGMYMLHKLREIGLSARVLEAGSGVGGTWYWNRYPGARCDVESVEYCYEFSDELVQQWDWSERYASQPEILSYANHVADRFDLRGDIEFDCRIASAHFDEELCRWTLTTTDGRQYQAQYCIFATGCLSAPIKPDIKGLNSFAGAVHHTGEWPHEKIGFSGRHVGVIGTGSSGIQSIPLIAQSAQRLTVFQRSATYTVPAKNEPLEPTMREAVKADYPAFRERSRESGYIFGARFPANSGFAKALTASEQQYFLQQYWDMGGLFFLRAFGDMQLDVSANEIAQDFVRAKIREMVTDPVTASRLCPDSIIGCKRLCADTGYYETYNRSNVELVDIKAAPIRYVSATGVHTAENEYPLDMLIFATGFDAMTGALDRIEICGRDGQHLRQNWQAGPSTLLGVQTAGFPNLFMITGPGSPSVLSNMIQSIEQNVEWVTNLLFWMREQKHQAAEAMPEDQASWMEYVASMVEPTLYSKCASWYRGANIDGKPQVFSPLVGYMAYVEHCDNVAAAGYPGFKFN